MDNQPGAAAPITCIVTIHGIGFEQPPRPGVAGYADGIHALLAAELGDETPLSDDPLRTADQVGDTVPIYVSSEWVTDGRPSPEAGLSRIGRWSRTADGQLAVDRSDAPLVRPGAAVAHVALVYTGLEETDGDVLALAEAVELGLPQLGHYASVSALVGTLIRDVTAMLQHGSQPADPTDARRPTLRVRTDERGLVAAPNRVADPTQPVSIIRQIEDDMAAYVARNDRRELVRGFVEEAILRLLVRDDVAALVVSAHSHGTAVAFDVLRRLPRWTPPKIAALVMAGSPLRKYTTLLSWGSEIGAIGRIPNWDSYYDPLDPVADELQPPPREVASMDRGPAPPASLFWALDPDTGQAAPASVRDHRVDNMRYSPPGALRAHNYWDNEPDFVRPLADLIRSASSTTTTPPPAPPSARPLREAVDPL